jgi:hypothetical protein
MDFATLKPGVNRKTFSYESLSAGRLAFFPAIIMGARMMAAAMMSRDTDFFMELVFSGDLLKTMFHI